MIASYFHNFIFIKTKKTGGTTVEMTLAAACGPQDIITPLGSTEELRRGNGQPLCRNFSSSPSLEQELRESMSRADRRSRREVEQKIVPHMRFINHLDAARIKDRLAPEFWERAYKFSIERHPYEKAVSMAYFSYKSSVARSGRSFEDHLDLVVRRAGYGGLRYYTIDGRVVVDEFLRCETLEEDIRRLAEKLHIPLSDALIMSKTGTRKDRRPAREVLSDVQKEIVHRRCKGEFKLFGHAL